VLNVRPNRVEVVRVDRATTLEEFNRRNPSVIPIEELAIVNQLEGPGARIEAGARGKRVVAERGAARPAEAGKRGRPPAGEIRRGAFRCREGRPQRPGTGRLAAMLITPGEVSRAVSMPRIFSSMALVSLWNAQSRPSAPALTTMPG